MKTLIVAATKAEIAPILAHYNLHGKPFIVTHNFDILITGVGMVATAFALGQHLNKNYNLILNVGIAGAFDKKLSLGSLVEITTDIFAELGAEDLDKFITLPDLGFGDNQFLASKNNLFDLPKVKGITVNKVHGCAESIAKVKSIFEPEVESMEGAAVFFASQKSGIPAKQIRAISNYVEPRNRDNWQIGLAIKNLNNWLINYLK